MELPPPPTHITASQPITIKYRKSNILPLTLLLDEQIVVKHPDVTPQCALEQAFPPNNSRASVFCCPQCNSPTTSSGQKKVTLLNPSDFTLETSPSSWTLDPDSITARRRGCPNKCSLTLIFLQGKADLPSSPSTPPLHLVWLASADFSPSPPPRPSTPPPTSLPQLPPSVHILAHAVANIVDLLELLLASPDPPSSAHLTPIRSQLAQILPPPLTPPPTPPLPNDSFDFDSWLGDMDILSHTQGRDYAYERAIHPDHETIASTLRQPGTIVQEVTQNDGSICVRLAPTPSSDVVRPRVVPYSPHSIIPSSIPPAFPINTAVIGDVLVKVDAFPPHSFADGGTVYLTPWCQPGVGLYVPPGQSPFPSPTPPWAVPLATVRSGSWIQHKDAVTIDNTPHRFLVLASVATSATSDAHAPEFAAAVRSSTASLTSPFVSSPPLGLLPASRPPPLMDDIASVASALDAPGAGHVVHIVGPKRSGRASIALAIVQSLDLSNRYPDGLVWWGRGRNELPPLPRIDGVRVFPDRKFLVVIDEWQLEWGSRRDIRNLLGLTPDSMTSVLVVEETMLPPPWERSWGERRPRTRFPGDDFVVVAYDNVHPRVFTLLSAPTIDIDPMSCSLPALISSSDTCPSLLRALLAVGVNNMLAPILDVSPLSPPLMVGVSGVREGLEALARKGLVALHMVEAENGDGGQLVEMVCTPPLFVMSVAALHTVFDHEWPWEFALSPHASAWYAMIQGGVDGLDIKPLHKAWWELVSEMLTSSDVDARDWLLVGGGASGVRWDRAVEMGGMARASLPLEDEAYWMSRVGGYGVAAWLADARHAGWDGVGHADEEGLHGRRDFDYDERHRRRFLVGLRTALACADHDGPGEWGVFEAGEGDGPWKVEQVAGKTVLLQDRTYRPELPEWQWCPDPFQSCFGLCSVFHPIGEEFKGIGSIMSYVVNEPDVIMSDTDGAVVVKMVEGKGMWIDLTCREPGVDDDAREWKEVHAGIDVLDTVPDCANVVVLPPKDETMVACVLLDYWSRGEIEHQVSLVGIAKSQGSACGQPYTLVPLRHDSLWDSSMDGMCEQLETVRWAAFHGDMILLGDIDVVIAWLPQDGAPDLGLSPEMRDWLHSLSPCGTFLLWGGRGSVGEGMEEWVEWSNAQLNA